MSSDFLFTVIFSHFFLFSNILYLICGTLCHYGIVKLTNTVRHIQFSRAGPVHVKMVVNWK